MREIGLAGFHVEAMSHLISKVPETAVAPAAEETVVKPKTRKSGKGAKVLQNLTTYENFVDNSVPLRLSAVKWFLQETLTHTTVMMKLAL